MFITFLKNGNIFIILIDTNIFVYTIINHRRNGVLGKIGAHYSIIHVK